MSQDGSFLFDPRRFWGDSRVRMMNGEEGFLYFKLLCLQWENGDLPTDPDELACQATEGRRSYTAESIAGDSKHCLSPAKASLMHRLSECFETVDGDDSKMRNPFMHETREQWRSVQKQRSEAGRKGGLKSRKPAKTKGKEAPLKPRLSPDEAKGKQRVTKVREVKEREQKIEETQPQKVAVGAAEDGDIRPAAPGQLTPTENRKLYPYSPENRMDYPGDEDEPHVVGNRGLWTRPDVADWYRCRGQMGPPRHEIWFPVKRGSGKAKDVRQAATNGNGFELETPVYRRWVAEWRIGFGEDRLRPAKIEPHLDAALMWLKRKPERLKTERGLKRFLAGWLATAKQGGELEIEVLHDQEAEAAEFAKWEAKFTGEPGYDV